MSCRLLAASSLLVVLGWSALSAADGAGPVAQRMQGYVEKQVVSGAVTLVAQKGQVVSLEAVGQADLASGRPMKPDTLFWIASMTKPITATAVFILQDEGKLNVNDPAGKYLPEYGSLTVTGSGSPKRAVTIADLLSHTSGVANPAADGLSANPTLAETAAAIAKQPLQFEPGTQWKYGSGLTVAGRIVEVVSGQSFDKFLEDRIFKPLKMVDTTFYPSDAQRERLATVYRWDKEASKLAPVVRPGDPNVRRAPNPSGGLASTAPDYFRFFQMIRGGGELDGQRVLSAAAVKQMTAIHTGEIKAGFSNGQAWGLGWGIVREPTGQTAKLSPGSHGHGGAFGTQAWIDPQRDAVVILMIARSDLGSGPEADIRGAFTEVAVRQLK